MNKIELIKPKAVIFDWDNTIVNTWPIMYNALKDTMVFMGLEPWSFEETKQRMHLSMRDSFSKFFGEDKLKEAGTYYQAQYTKYHQSYKLSFLPGIQELLNFLFYDQALFLAIISNKMGNRLRNEVEQLKLNKYFTKIIGAGDAAEDKPSKKPVLLALEKSDIKPSEEVWFIGDSIADIECANISGCMPILLVDEYTDYKLYNKYNKLLFIDNHHNLLAKIKNLYKVD